MPVTHVRHVRPSCDDVAIVAKRRTLLLLARARAALARAVPGDFREELHPREATGEEGGQFKSKGSVKTSPAGRRPRAPGDPGGKSAYGRLRARHRDERREDVAERRKRRRDTAELMAYEPDAARRARVLARVRERGRADRRELDRRHAAERARLGKRLAKQLAERREKRAVEAQRRSAPPRFGTLEDLVIGQTGVAVVPGLTLDRSASNRPFTTLRQDQDDRLASLAGDEKIDSLLRDRFGDEAASPEWLAKRFARNLGKFLDGSGLHVRVHPQVLIDVLDDGRFKSQFETGTSSGLMDTKIRDRVEREVLGVQDSDDQARPIYGYFSPQPYQEPVSCYGKVVVQLKDHVRPRATFTVGDSLDSTSGYQTERVIGEPVVAPSHRAVPLNVLTTGWKDGLRRIEALRNSQDAEQAEKVERKLRKQLDCWLGETTPETIGRWAESANYYVEAQVHGGVAASDIERVVFECTKRPSPEMTDRLDAAGIPWSVASDEDLQ